MAVRVRTPKMIFSDDGDREEQRGNSIRAFMTEGGLGSRGFFYVLDPIFNAAGRAGNEA